MGVERARPAAGTQRSVFEPSSQHGDVDKKIVVTLERLSQVFRILLRSEAQGRGLSPIQARFLVHLLHHGPALRRVSLLAQEFDLTGATVSDAVGSLEKKGLIRRERSPHDGRVATLCLTPAGERTARELAAWANVVEEHLEDRSPEDKEAVMRFLMGLISTLQKSGLISVARMCVTCRFFRTDADSDEGSSHHCALLDLPLSGSELRTDCPEHELATS